jgi:hypothetical protein
MDSFGPKVWSTWHSDRKNSLRKSDRHGIIYGIVGVLALIPAVLSRIAISEKSLI